MNNQSSAPYVNPTDVQGPSNPLDPSTNPQLSQAAANVTATNNAVTSSTQGNYTLPVMLRDALINKFTSDNPLIAARDKAGTDYLNSLSDAQKMVDPSQNGGNVYTPAQQADIINRFQNAKSAPLATANYELNLQEGGLENLVAKAQAAQEANTAGLVGKATSAQKTFEDLQTALKAQADIATQNRQITLQYQVPDVASMMTDVASGKDTPLAGERAYFLAQYNGTTNQQLKDSIAGQWAARHPELPSLQPTPFDPGERDSLAASNTTLGYLDEMERLVHKDPNMFGTVGGNFAKKALSQPSTYNLASNDAKQFNDLAIGVSTAGERIQIGGRNTGYLFDRLNPSYPQLYKNAKDVLPEIKRMRTAILTDMQTAGRQHSIENFSQIPGFTGPISVKNNATGKVGTIPANEWDPNKYTQL